MTLILPALLKTGIILAQLKELDQNICKFSIDKLHFISNLCVHLLNIEFFYSFTHQFSLLLLFERKNTLETFSVLRYDIFRIYIDRISFIARNDCERSNGLTMTLKRLLAVFLTLLLVFSTTGGALAANKQSAKEAKTKPTLKITVPKEGIESGAYGQFTINASVPGFITIELLDSNGISVLKIADKSEIHSKDNEFEITASSDSGDAIPAGTYTIQATMVSQYGTESNLTTKDLKITAPAVDPDAPNAATGTANAAAGQNGTAANVQGTANNGINNRNATGAYDPYAYNNGSAANTAYNPYAAASSGNAANNPYGTASSGTSTYNPYVTASTGNAANNPYGSASTGTAANNPYGTASSGTSTYNPYGTASTGNAANNPYGTASTGNAANNPYGTASTGTAANNPYGTASTGTSTYDPYAQGSTAVPPTNAAAQAPATIPQVVTYRSSGGFLSIGEEGYQIGVGVSDVYPQTETSFWNLPANPSDADLWAALTRPMTYVNIGEQEVTSIFDSPYDGRSKLGSVAGVSQGVNVLNTRSDGWSLVEAYRNEDGAFIRGYIKTSRLILSDVNTTYGIVIDKRSQTLVVYMNGQRVGSCLVSTGLPTVENLQRETPAGEFKVATRRGTTTYTARQKGFSRYSMRINNNVHLQEIPTTKRNGSDYSILESYLGSKQTRGTICVQARASADGGINAEWLWRMTDTNKKVKILIIDDKTRDMIPVGR